MRKRNTNELESEVNEMKAGKYVLRQMNSSIEEIKMMISKSITIIKLIF